MTDAEKILHRIINSNSWDEDFPTNDQMDEIIEELAAANLTIEQGWQDIETAPKDEPFLYASYGPTNWAYMVFHATLETATNPKLRAMRLKHATKWRPLPAAPGEG